MANRFGARPAFWWALGGSGLLFLWLTRETDPEQTLVETESKKLPNRSFEEVLPSAGRPYAEAILRVAKEEDLSPYLLAAIMRRETVYGTSRSCVPKGPSCRGDAGHGHGLMQIDDRSHAEWLASNNWADPYTNIKKGAAVFKSSRRFFAARPRTPGVIVKSTDSVLPPGTYVDPRPLDGDILLAAAVAGYNAGPGRVLQAVAAGFSPDAVTYSKDYASDVIGTMNELIAKAAGVA